MAHDALTSLYDETAWDDPDVLVVDLPPGTGDVVLTTLQEVRVDGVVFVTTPFHTSVEDTSRSLELFAENGVPVLGTVVNMDRFVCESCGHDHDLFDGPRPSRDLDVPVLARLPFSPELQAKPTPGEPPAAFERVAGRVREALDGVERIALPADPVDLRGEAPEQRYERVREAYTALEPGEALYLVSDRDPTPAGEFLVELSDREGEPSSVLPGFSVERRGPDTWALRARRPDA